MARIPRSDRKGAGGNETMTIDTTELTHLRRLLTTYGDAKTKGARVVAENHLCDALFAVAPELLNAVDESNAFKADAEELQNIVEDLQDILERHGFRRCDIPACNCNGYHHVGGLAERWRELEEVVNTNGITMLAAVKKIAAEHDALRTRLHEIHDAWCSLDAEDRLDHSLLCGAEDIPIRPCDCGLDRLKAAIRAVSEATKP
jgi:hypothetical protein